jgi:hypothetical protein
MGISIDWPDFTVRGGILISIASVEAGQSIARSVQRRRILALNDYGLH